MSNIIVDTIPSHIRQQLSSIINAEGYEDFCDAVERVDTIPTLDPDYVRLVNTDVPSFDVENIIPAETIGDVSDIVAQALRDNTVSPASYVYGLMGHTFVAITELGSYRGSYDEVMFSATSNVSEGTQVAVFDAMLDYACDNGEFYGYGGGEFYMDVGTLAYVDFHGSSSEERIVGVLFHNRNIVIITLNTEF